MEFVELLMETIIKSKDIPKAQVERYVSPILEIFLPSALSVILGKNIEMITPEFPIKKDGNNQSTNVDFLLMSEDEIIFVELKTDTTSSNDTQMQIYQNLKNSQNLGLKLFEDFEQIKSKSSKKKKYNTHQENIDCKLKELKNLQKLKIVYLVPKKLKDKSAFDEEGKKVITFEELYQNNEINHEFANEWKIITSYLRALDEN